MALENTLTENFNGTLPEDVKSNSDCITLYDSEISDCISEMVKVDKTINVEKLKETYKNMFSSEIEDYSSVSNIHNEYIYSRITNRYYVNELKSNSTSSKIYYVYYKNYNSPYEHVDLATVDVSVLCVELEGNGKLYKVSDIFGNLIKEQLSESDINTYVRNIKNYDLSTIHVTYKFDNNSTYGLTLSSIDKESNWE